MSWRIYFFNKKKAAKKAQKELKREGYDTRLEKATKLDKHIRGRKVRYKIRARR